MREETNVVSRQDIEEFRAWVTADVRRRATSEQQAALQATPDSCRRWVSTLRLLIDEVTSDIDIRERTASPWGSSSVLTDRTRWIDHLSWLSKVKHFRTKCNEKLVEAEEALRRVTGLSVTAERLVTSAAQIIPSEHPWQKEYRTWEVNRLGELGPAPVAIEPLPPTEGS